jgi:dolichol-phosphate mannosyltransferase
MTEASYGLPAAAQGTGRHAGPYDGWPAATVDGWEGGAQARPLVSVVVPALDEADNVPGLMTRFAELAAAHPRYAFELVVVDDGSSDATTDLALSLAKPEQKVTVVQLARTFGSHYAISAGLARCEGDCAVVFGADLQEPPELLANFLAMWEAGNQIVWGVRRTRTGRSFANELVSKAFSVLFARYANLAGYPPEGPSGVLVDRCVIDELARLPERNRNVLALIAWLGFTQARVEYNQLARKHGTSRWTKRKMFKLAADSLIQFSSMPLRACTFTGVGVALAGLAYAVFLVARAIVGVSTPSGWPTVLVIMLVLGGAQLTVIGVMGEYLWRAVEEVRGRPLFVVRAVHRAPASVGRNARPASDPDPVARTTFSRPAESPTSVTGAGAARGEGSVTR